MTQISTDDIPDDILTTTFAPLDALRPAGEMASLIKLARSQMLKWKRQHLMTVQGGKCLLCGKPIDLHIKGEGVIDHDHNTGRIRGILHRSCNAAEGRVANAAGRWGAKSMEYAEIIPWLENLLAYLKRPQTRFVYPFHKTADEKRLDRNAAARKARAAAKARAVLARKSDESA